MCDLFANLVFKGSVLLDLLEVLLSLLVRSWPLAASYAVLAAFASVNKALLSSGLGEKDDSRWSSCKRRRCLRMLVEI